MGPDCQDCAGRSAFGDMTPKGAVLPTQGLLSAPCPNFSSQPPNTTRWCQTAQIAKIPVVSSKESKAGMSPHTALHCGTIHPSSPSRDAAKSAGGGKPQNPSVMPGARYPHHPMPCWPWQQPPGQGEAGSIPGSAGSMSHGTKCPGTQAGSWERAVVSSLAGELSHGEVRLVASLSHFLTLLAPKIRK